MSIAVQHSENFSLCIRLLLLRLGADVVVREGAGRRILRTLVPRAVVVHPNRIDVPISILEAFRMVLDVVFAAIHTRLPRARASPNVTRPVAAKGGVEDHRLLVEVTLGA